MKIIASASAPSRQVVGKRRQHKHVQERGNTRRRQLLNAAESLLDTVPIEELSFRQVCNKAGVPEGSAYHFFANRYDLLTALASHLVDTYSEVYARPIPKSKINSWHDIVDTIISKAVQQYRSNPAARQIWLSGRTPPHVRLVDRVSDKTVSHVIRQVFERHFKLPPLPCEIDIFFYFLEVCDVILSLSVIEHGKITAPMIEEARRVGKGYLGTYFPAVLERVD